MFSRKSILKGVSQKLLIFSLFNPQTNISIRQGANFVKHWQMVQFCYGVIATE